MGGILEADHRVSLGTLLALNNVELDLISLFQRLVSVLLNRGVVNEYIRAVVASDEPISLGVVEPLDLPFVLSHVVLLSLGTARIRRTRGIAHR